jgi:hypothetical protein
VPFIKLQFKPGLNRDQTDYSNEGGWYECDKIRFRSGYPEKIGGWLKSSPTAFAGVCRQMMNYITSYSDNFLTLGTNEKVYIEAGGEYYDITPLRSASPTLTSPTTNNSVYTSTTTPTKVTLTLSASHNAQSGGYVTISGVTNTGTYSVAVTVASVSGSNKYFIGGVQQPTLELSEGSTYIFSYPSAHPFALSTTSNGTHGGGVEYTTGVTRDSGANTLTIVVASGAPTLYYYCTIHSNMGGQANTPVATSIGGIPASQINGNHQVTVVNSTSFTIAVTGPVTSNASAGGGTAISMSFEIDPGNAIATGGYGWGVGTWGRDAWGTGTTGAPINLPQRDWWFDNFDNDIVMNIRNGPAYWWYRAATVSPISSLATRAITLQAYATAEGFTSSAVPVKVMQVLVSQQDKHLLAFGAVPYGSTNADDFDPLLIRWADQDSPGNWTPSATTSAGDLRVSRGSRIVRALPTRQEILVWTDTHLYTLQFLGTADVFGLQEYADNISVASPRAIVSASNVVYWMGQDKFYAYTGRVETLPCTLRNEVFNNINFAQSDQIVCGTNEQWNEIWWFYPTSNSNYNNAYVIYNHLEQIWYYGTIDRTAWLDTPLRHFPQAANTPITVNSTTGVVTTGSGYVYAHENGVNDDILPIDAYIQSSDFDIGEGDNFMLTRRIIPDIGFDGSTAATPEATIQVRPRNFPGSNFSSDPADAQRVIETSVGTYTDQVFMRARARQMAFKIRSQNLGVQWQLGTPRLDVRQDGSR